MEPAVPEWVLWFGTGLGALLAAFVGRMGWNAAGGKKAPGKAVGVESVGLIDGAAADRLASSIEGLTLEGITSRKAAEAMRDTIEKAGGKVISEVEKLREEIREHREEIRHHGDAMKLRR